jgi:excisionase family DNA binding protein
MIDAYSMEEVTALLGCSEETVVARIDAGELAALKYGRGWVFPREAFVESLNDAARAERQRKRAEREARSRATTVIDIAKKQDAQARRRTPPTLPSLPGRGAAQDPRP